MKQKIKVSDELKEQVKAFNRTKKMILESLKEEPKTVPEIADEINIPVDEVTFCLMSLRKFGNVEVDDIDDMDEFFYYKLKK